MNLLFTVIGGKFKIQVQDSDLEYFFFEIWRFEKHITLSEKNPPLVKTCMRRIDRCQVNLNETFTRPDFFVIPYLLF